LLVEDDARVTLLVHQVRPPFLDGRVSFSNIREAVATVKDASSDFAKMAREGSATLRHLRETKVKEHFMDCLPAHFNSVLIPHDPLLLILYRKSILCDRSSGSSEAVAWGTQ
jgi:hypothetical protein